MIPAPKLVVIGASAGGPAALVKVLSPLPPDFPASIVVVQHLAPQFAPGMASWLGEFSRLPVRVIEEGDRPERGVVLLAATRDHLALKSATRLGYTPLPVEGAYRPSIDVFFASVDRFWSGGAIAVLLTGMGRDGARGLKQLRERGRHTIAQDRASSAVYGMPKEAAAIDAAVEILPVERIARRLVELLGDASEAERREVRE